MQGATEKDTYMADSPSHRDTGDPGGSAGRGSAPGTPRWVKVSGTIALSLVLLVAVLFVFGGGNHGPGRHTGGGGQAPPASGVPGDAGGHTPPPDGHTP